VHGLIGFDKPIDRCSIQLSHGAKMNYIGRCSRFGLLALIILLVAAASACGGKRSAARIPSPTSSKKPAAETRSVAPTVSLTATPATIRAGQSTTLEWEAQNADALVIDGGIGTVGLTGSRVLTLKSSTTYTATASSAAGTATASARIAVTGQADDAAADMNVSGRSTGMASVEALFDQSMRDVFFEYDKYELSPEAVDILYANANFLRQYANLEIMVEGHCDERGTAEYNLALGDRRAKVAKDFLVNLGIRADRISTISYGEERPFGQGHDEESWIKNRRAHFALAKP
jgi:peptidoglycan-associated lipoprotein